VVNNDGSNIRRPTSNRLVGGVTSCPSTPPNCSSARSRADDIKEFVHGHQLPADGQLHPRRVRPGDDFQVPGDKLKPFLQFCLGVNYVNTAPCGDRSPCSTRSTAGRGRGACRSTGQQYDGDDTDAVIWDFQVTPAKWKQYECVRFRSTSRGSRCTPTTSHGVRVPAVRQWSRPRVKIVTVDNGQVVYDANAGDAAWNLAAQRHHPDRPPGRGRGIRSSGGTSLRTSSRRRTTTSCQVHEGVKAR
jgi:hypothetical protein